MKPEITKAFLGLQGSQSMQIAFPCQKKQSTWSKKMRFGLPHGWFQVSFHTSWFNFRGAHAPSWVEHQK